MRNDLIATVLSASAASVLVLVLGAAASPLVPGDAAAATRAVAGGRAAALGTWGKAEQVPGSAALNPGGVAEARSVSCGSVGNCSAGGNMRSSAGGEAWVASQKNGSWGAAKKVARSG